VDAALGDSFKQRNQAPIPLRPELALETPYQLYSQAELDEIFAANEGAGWKAFFQEHPKGRGVLRLSRAGFNTDGSQALVCASQDDYKRSFMAEVIAGTGGGLEDRINRFWSGSRDFSSSASDGFRGFSQAICGANETRNKSPALLKGRGLRVYICHPLLPSPGIGRGGRGEGYAPPAADTNSPPLPRSRW
jgi:hypothetical protein